MTSILYTGKCSKLIRYTLPVGCQSPMCKKHFIEHSQVKWRLEGSAIRFLDEYIWSTSCAFFSYRKGSKIHRENSTGSRNFSNPLRYLHHQFKDRSMIPIIDKENNEGNNSKSIRPKNEPENNYWHQVTMWLWLIIDAFLYLTALIHQYVNIAGGSNEALLKDLLECLYNFNFDDRIFFLLIKEEKDSWLIIYFLHRQEKLNSMINIASHHKFFDDHSR